MCAVSQHGFPRVDVGRQEKPELQAPEEGT